MIPLSHFKRSINALFLCFFRSALHLSIGQKYIMGHGPSLLGEPEAFESTKINVFSPPFFFFWDQSRFISKIYIGGSLSCQGHHQGTVIRNEHRQAKPTCSNPEPWCYGGKTPALILSLMWEKTLSNNKYVSWLITHQNLSWHAKLPTVVLQETQNPKITVFQDISPAVCLCQFSDSARSPALQPDIFWHF